MDIERKKQAFIKMLYICNMIKKIIHVADIHIPNDQKLRPYEEMLMTFLKELYKNEIEGQNADEIRIVICGDTFQNKVRTTNEAKALFHLLLNYCNEMCKTYIIAGNHDMLQNNKDKMDSINPTFDIENVYPNVIYLDKYLEFKSGYVEDENVVWALYSMYDNFASPNVEHSQFPDSRIIGLYHGDIVGAVTDVGNVRDSGIDTDLFSECDCVMAGHIHKFQEIKKNGVPIVYAGSLFQKDAGENTTGHGYVVWNMEDMTYKHVEVTNKYRFFKFKINNYEAFAEDVEDLINL